MKERRHWDRSEHGIGTPALSKIDRFKVKTWQDKSSRLFLEYGIASIDCTDCGETFWYPGDTTWYARELVVAANALRQPVCKKCLAARLRKKLHIEGIPVRFTDLCLSAAYEKLLKARRKKGGNKV